VLLIVVLYSCWWSLSAPAADPPACLSADRLKERIYFLASNALQGRYPGSPGFAIAAAYVTSQLQAAGLHGANELPGVQGFSQPFVVQRRTISQTPVVTLHLPSGTETYPSGHLKLFQSEGLGTLTRSLPVVFAGFGISEPAAEWDDLADLDLDGKLVVMLMGTPVLDGHPMLPEQLHHTYAPLNSFFRKRLFARRAAAVLFLFDPSLEEEYDSLPLIPDAPQLVLDDPDPESFGGPALGFLSPELSQSLFRDDGAPDPRDVSARRVTPRLLPGVRMSIEAAFTDEEVPTQNIVCVVPGTDQSLREQYVVVSAHLDHLAPAADKSIYPGANDNASGAGALLEIARSLARQPLRRSVLCVFFSAEEGGSMGSRYFLSHCPVNTRQIVANVNMDMIGRTEEGLNTGRDHYALDSGRVTPAFTQLIKAVNGRSASWPLRFEHPDNLGTSDHYVFDALRIPAVNFYSGRVVETHQPTDTPDTIEYDKVAAIARLALAVTQELGDREPLW